MLYFERTLQHFLASAGIESVKILAKRFHHSPETQTIDIIFNDISKIFNKTRPVGSCKIFGVLIATFFIISKNIGDAMATPATPLSKTLKTLYFALLPELLNW